MHSKYDKSTQLTMKGTCLSKLLYHNALRGIHDFHLFVSVKIRFPDVPEMTSIETNLQIPFLIFIQNYD